MLTLDFNACMNLVDLFSMRDDLSPMHPATETLLNTRKEMQEELLSITEKEIFKSAIAKATQDLAEALFTWQKDTGVHYSVFFPKIDAINDSMTNPNDKDTIAQIDAIRAICNKDLGNTNPLSMYQYGLEYARQLVIESNAANAQPSRGINGDMQVESNTSESTISAISSTEEGLTFESKNPAKTKYMVTKYIEKVLSHHTQGHVLYGVVYEAEQALRNGELKLKT